MYKHDYDKTLNRLVAILSKLYNGEHLSVKELALEFNVSDRTIQRDFNDRLISFPIEKEGRRWKMKDGFKIEKNLSIEEQVVLKIMENVSSSLGKTFSKKSKKLLSKIKNSDDNPIYAKLQMENIDDKLNIIQILEECIKLKKQVSCSYKMDNNSSLELTIKPLKIANYEGFWYLIAIDIKTNLIKKYYIKNIFNIKQTKNNFTTDSKIEQLLENSINIWFDEKVEPFIVKLHIDSAISKFIKRKPLSTTQIIESIYDDGSFDMTIKITHEMEVIPLVKYWLPYIDVLEPIWIKDTIIKDLKKFIN